MISETSSQYIHEDSADNVNVLAHGSVHSAHLARNGIRYVNMCHLLFLAILDFLEDM